MKDLGIVKDHSDNPWVEAVGWLVALGLCAAAVYLSFSAGA